MALYVFMFVLRLHDESTTGSLHVVIEGDV